MSVDARLRRLVSIMSSLQSARRGRRSVELAERHRTSRATIDRDLRVLREAGVPIRRDTCNGETRHVLDTRTVPALEPSLRQILALRVARDHLRALDGSEVMRELDSLILAASPNAELPRSAATGRPTTHFSATPAPRAIVQALDAAIRAGRQLRLVYRAASHGGREREYVLDPLRLRVVDGGLYLVACVAATGAPRKFKAVRIARADVLASKACLDHPNASDEKLFGRSVKVWGGEPTEVRIRLHRDVAHLAHEYALISDQRVDTAPTGDVIITASVAGVVEATRWILGWGANAEALAPPTLRDAVATELRRGLDHYEASGETAPAPRGALAPRAAPIRARS